MLGILLHPLASALYATVWFANWHADLHLEKSRRQVYIVLAAALTLHALSLEADLFGTGSFSFGFGNALSLSMWLTMMFYAIENMLSPLNELLTLTAPAAAISVLLPLVPGTHPMAIALADWPLSLHIVVAMLAYSFFTLSAFHAMLMMMLEKRLHNAHLPSRLKNAPPLLVQEKILFRLIASGFVFLTITVLTSTFFSETIFKKSFEINHKSLFSILSWFVFGALLAGKHFWGWRRKVALRWTMAGLGLILLAYSGSRFVLEIILGRST